MNKLENYTCLVTGADGFIGSNLTESLLKTGAKVRALVQYNSQNSWGWLEPYSHNPPDNLEIISGDIRDLNFCYDLTKGIDIVFHLAALIAIPYSYHSPSSYIDTNISGTSNVCLAALKNNVSKVLHTSTSEVYGTAQYVPIDEKHPLQAQSPYSASKIAADSMAISYFNAFELPLVVVRPFNTYGPRQSARAVIPTIISQIANGKKEIKLGDLSPTRDFNYVLDTCEGFIKAAETDNINGEIINLGSGTEISIGDLVLLIAELMGESIKVVSEQKRIRPEKSEVHRLLCDNSKAKKLLNFKSNYNLKEGLSETIKWFSDENNLKMYKANIYNV